MSGGTFCGGDNHAYDNGVKRRKRDMSVLLEQASSSKGVSSSGKGTRSCSAKANDKLRALFDRSCQENLPKAKLRAQQAAF